MSGICVRGIRNLFKTSSSHLRQFIRHDSGFQKASISILNMEEDNATFIDAFSVLGFRLSNNIKVVGPMAVFPRSVLHWNVSSAEDINEDSLSLFTLLEPKIDILIIGKGDNSAEVSPSIISYLRSKKINVEVLNTESACSTFNFLNAEKRYVAAAMIPPQFVQNYAAVSDLDMQDDPTEELYNLQTNYTDPNPYVTDKILDGIPEKWKQLLSSKSNKDYADDTNQDQSRDEQISKERVRITEEMKDKGLLGEKDNIRVENKIKEERSRILAEKKTKE